MPLSDIVFLFLLKQAFICFDFADTTPGKNDVIT